MGALAVKRVAVPELVLTGECEGCGSHDHRTVGRRIWVGEKLVVLELCVPCHQVGTLQREQDSNWQLGLALDAQFESKEV